MELRQTWIFLFWKFYSDYHKRNTTSISFARKRNISFFLLFASILLSCFYSKSPSPISPIWPLTTSWRGLSRGSKTRITFRTGVRQIGQRGNGSVFRSSKPAWRKQSQQHEWPQSVTCWLRMISRQMGQTWTLSCSRMMESFILIIATKFWNKL